MNCECFYVIKNSSLEGAREFAKVLNETANKQQEEVYPVYISQANNNFSATSDYDNEQSKFTVSKGSWLVFAHGKDYCMNRIKPIGGKRGFPNKTKHKDFYNNWNYYITDIEPV